MRPFVRNVLIGGSVCGLFGAAVIMQVQLKFESNIHSFDQDLSQLEKADVIMVLGAGIKPDGTPSDALRDRLLVGMMLLQQQKSDRILVTGDNGEFRRDEVQVMKRFLTDRGVPESVIVVDGRGYRTYESCKNAAALHMDRIYVVTQRFHIARALYLCSSFGIQSEAVTADIQTYRQIVWFWIRDLLSSLKAWWDVTVMTPRSPA